MYTMVNDVLFFFSEAIKVLGTNIVLEVSSKILYFYTLLDGDITKEICKMSKTR